MEFKVDDKNKNKKKGKDEKCGLEVIILENSFFLGMMDMYDDNSNQSFIVDVFFIKQENSSNFSFVLEFNLVVFSDGIEVKVDEVQVDGKEYLGVEDVFDEQNLQFLMEYLMNSLEKVDWQLFGDLGLVVELFVIFQDLEGVLFFKKMKLEVF